MTDGQSFILTCCKDNNYDDFLSAPDAWFVDTQEQRLRKFTKQYFIDNTKLPDTSVLKAKFSLGRTPRGTTKFYMDELKNRFIRIKSNEA